MTLDNSFVIILVVFCFVCSSTMDPHQVELMQHYDHLAYISDFHCSTPQRQVIPVHKLFSKSQSRGKAYFPDVTVLHRCDECTGSCVAKQKCAPKLTELVLLPFKATYLKATENYDVGSWAMEYHELLNHTECGCVPVKRPKDFSKFYRSQRDLKVEQGLLTSEVHRVRVSFTSSPPEYNE